MTPVHQTTRIWSSQISNDLLTDRKTFVLMALKHTAKSAAVDRVGKESINRQIM